MALELGSFDSYGNYRQKGGGMVWPALIAAAATIGSAAYSQSSAQGASKQARKFAREQRQWDLDVANTAHQREIADLQAAGLNPILSGTGGGGAPSPQAPGAQTFMGDTPDFAGAGFSALAAKRAQELQDEQLELLKAQTAKTKEESFNLHQLGYGIEANAEADVLESKLRSGEAAYRLGLTDPSKLPEREAEWYGSRFRATTGISALQDSQLNLNRAEEALKRGHVDLARKQMDKVVQELKIGESAVARSELQKKIWTASEAELFEMATMLGGVVGQATGGSFIGAYSARGLLGNRRSLPRVPGLRNDVPSF